MSVTNTPSKIFALQVRPWGLVVASGVIACAATVLGFCGGVWWFFDLFCHFRVQYFVGLAAVALLLLVPRYYKIAAFFGGMAAVNLGTILPLYLSKPAEPANVTGTFKVLLANVNTESGKPEKVGRAIKELKPDIIILEEVNDRWLSSLAAVLAGFPHFKAVPRDDNFGIALYSRFTLVKSEVRELGDADVPSIFCEVDTPGGRVLIVATHPLPPAGAEHSRARNAQLEQLAVAVKEAVLPVMVVGDLNVTPWCSQFQQLLRVSRLQDSSQGRGVLATWPVFMPIFSIPLDHCLHTSNIHIYKKARGPDVGSDHYPLVIDFGIVKSSGGARIDSAQPSPRAP